MEKNIMEQTNENGVNTRFVEENNHVPTRYLLAAGLGIAGLVLLSKIKSKKGRPSFFRQYIFPLIMAGVYKKGMEVVQHALKSPDAEIPQNIRQPHTAMG